MQVFLFNLEFKFVLIAASCLYKCRYKELDIRDSGGTASKGLIVKGSVLCCSLAIVC